LSDWRDSHSRPIDDLVLPGTNGQPFLSPTDSSLEVTTDFYGHWEHAERKVQAAKMEGAFPI
jgi:hypothetical protein